jgi:hypothetical protein
LAQERLLVGVIREPAKASSLSELLKYLEGNGGSSEHVLAEIRGVADRAAKGVSQGRPDPMRVEGIDR